MTTKTKKTIECRFCKKQKSAQGIRMHENSCKRAQARAALNNPVVDDSPKEHMTIEQLMEEIKMGEEHVKRLRKELGNRLATLGLRFTDFDSEATPYDDPRLPENKA